MSSNFSVLSSGEALSAAPPAAVPAPPAYVPGDGPHDDDPPPPTYLGVGPGADWFADGGHEPMAGGEPDQGSGGGHADALGTVVAAAPQWAPYSGL